jgi:hypothetical protein
MKKNYIIRKIRNILENKNLYYIKPALYSQTFSMHKKFRFFHVLQ